MRAKAKLEHRRIALCFGLASSSVGLFCKKGAFVRPGENLGFVFG